MNIPGLHDLAAELREGKDALMGVLESIVAGLDKTNALLEQVVENTEPDELP